MQETPAGLLLAFLLPFHVGGGAALGIALRRFAQEGFKPMGLLRNAFLLLWGSVFGGMPLLFGLSMEPGWVFWLQLGTFLGCVAFVAARYEWLRDLYSHPGMFVASFGLAFLLVGATVTTFMLVTGDSEVLLVGLVFVGVGGLITLAGLWMLLRDR